MEKKIYSKPMMTAEAFEPQEYCTACWLVSLHCQGESASQGQIPRYVYDTNNTLLGDLHDSKQYGGKHHAHDITVELRTEDDITPNPDNISYIIGATASESGNSVGDLQLAWATGSNGHNTFNGWAWFASVDNGVHFSEVPVIERYYQRPNHS